MRSLLLLLSLGAMAMASKPAGLRNGNHVINEADQVLNVDEVLVVDPTNNRK